MKQVIYTYLVSGRNDLFDLGNENVLLPYLFHILGAVYLVVNVREKRKKSPFFISKFS